MTRGGNSPKLKATFHIRNKHQGRYDFKSLVLSCPELQAYVRPNPYGDMSINFSDPKAVVSLNKALLKQYYGIDWDIPAMYLCPPIPGRSDYVHHLSDLLGNKVQGSTIKCLDIGVGANCIYPIVGINEYGWSFVGTDIDSKALDAANEIIKKNPELKAQLQCRLQKHPANIFEGIISQGEKFDLTMCNPPFHLSMEEAQKGTLRKIKNLSGRKTPKVSLNFGGKSNELWCEGGEVEFVKNMIIESKSHAESCTWFTTLVSKESNLKHAYRNLRLVKPTSIKTIAMGQGQKQSRILAWSFSVK
jgi:23S rRNA (adenine1618-N6)-methyltransferase